MEARRWASLAKLVGVSLFRIARTWRCAAPPRCVRHPCTEVAVCRVLQACPDADKSRTSTQSTHLAQGVVALGPPLATSCLGTAPRGRPARPNHRRPGGHHFRHGAWKAVTLFLDFGDPRISRRETGRVDGRKGFVGEWCTVTTVAPRPWPAASSARCVGRRLQAHRQRLNRRTGTIRRATGVSLCTLVAAHCAECGLPRAAITPCTTEGAGTVAPACVSRVLGARAGLEGGWQRQDWQDRREAPRGRERSRPPGALPVAGSGRGRERSRSQERSRPRSRSQGRGREPRAQERSRPRSRSQDRGRDRDRSQDRGGEGGWRQGRERSDYGRLHHDDRQHAGWERGSGARSRDARDWAEPRSTDRGRERDWARGQDRESERYSDRGYAHSDRGGLFSRVEQGMHPPPARDMEHARERGARRPMWAEDGMQVLRAEQWHSAPRHLTRVHAHTRTAYTHARRKTQHTSTLPQRKHWHANTWTHTVAR